MKRTTFFLGLWLLFNFTLSAQLTLSKGNTQQRIDIGSYLELTLFKQYDCCDQEKYLGQLNRVSSDSIYLSVKAYQRTISFDEISNNNSLLKPQMSSTGAIAKHEIYDLNEFPNRAYKRKSEVRKGVGALLIITGLVTGLHYIGGSEDSRNRLLYSGGAQIGVGVLLISLFNKNKKYTFDQQKENSWMIN